MLSQDQVNSIVEKAAKRKLVEGLVRRVYSDPAVASDGAAALKITIVIDPKAVQKLEDVVLETLVQIHDDLLRAGEERFPIVEYATEKELADADSEP